MTTQIIFSIVFMIAFSLWGSFNIHRKKYGFAAWFYFNALFHMLMFIGYSFLSSGLV